MNFLLSLLIIQHIMDSYWSNNRAAFKVFARQLKLSSALESQIRMDDLAYTRPRNSFRHPSAGMLSQGLMAGCDMHGGHKLADVARSLSRLNCTLNRRIISATLEYILETGRMNWAASLPLSFSLSLSLSLPLSFLFSFSLICVVLVMFYV